MRYRALGIYFLTIRSLEVQDQGARLASVETSPPICLFTICPSCLSSAVSFFSDKDISATLLGPHPYDSI